MVAEADGVDDLALSFFHTRHSHAHVGNSIRCEWIDPRHALQRFSASVKGLLYLCLLNFNSGNQQRLPLYRRSSDRNICEQDGKPPPQNFTHIPTTRTHLSKPPNPYSPVRSTTNNETVHDQPLPRRQPDPGDDCYPDPGHLGFEHHERRLRYWIPGTPGTAMWGPARTVSYFHVGRLLRCREWQRFPCVPRSWKSYLNALALSLTLLSMILCRGRRST